MASSYYPIIIVGSGPAGISTALHLQKLSPDLTEKILIIEKASHLREKICGGVLTGSASRILKELSIDLNIPKITVRKIRFSYRSDYIDFPIENDAFVIRRNEFDNLLVQNAIVRGLRINQEEEVLDIKKNLNRLNVGTSKNSYSCDILVAADGA